LEDVKHNPEENNNPERYTTLHVKKAQLTWTYVETLKKIKNMQTLIAKARLEIDDMDQVNPEFRDQYMDKYKSARESAGLPVTETNDNFMKFLVEDIKLPEIEALYEELKAARKQ
jgi:phosphoglucomutase